MSIDHHQSLSDATFWARSQRFKSSPGVLVSTPPAELVIRAGFRAVVGAA